MKKYKKRRRKDFAELVDVLVEQAQRFPACSLQSKIYPQSEGETLFALDFINRKTSTQVSVSLGPAGGGFDGDDWSGRDRDWKTFKTRAQTHGPSQALKNEEQTAEARNKAEEHKFPKTKFESKSNFIHIMNTPST